MLFFAVGDLLPHQSADGSRHSCGTVARSSTGASLNFGLGPFRIAEVSKQAREPARDVNPWLNPVNEHQKPKSKSRTFQEGEAKQTKEHSSPHQKELPATLIEDSSYLAMEFQSLLCSVEDAFGISENQRTDNVSDCSEPLCIEQVLASSAHDFRKLSLALENSSGAARGLVSHLSNELAEHTAESSPEQLALLDRGSDAAKKKEGWSKLRTSLSTRDLKKSKIRTLDGRKKSSLLLASHKHLRRLDQKNCDESGGPDSDASPEQQKQKSGQPEGEEQSILLRTVGDLADTPEELRERIKTLQESQESVEDCGGMRHATSCIFERALRCCLRKAELLETLLNELAVLEAVSRCKTEVIQAITDGQTAREAGQKVMRLNALLKQIVHDGSPQDADKSDFTAFVQTFGLPSKHTSVLQARRVLKAEQDAWAAEICASSQQIFKDAKELFKPGQVEPLKKSTVALVELASLLRGMGASAEHPAVLQMFKMEKELLAWVALQIAQAEAQDDARVATMREQAGKLTPPGPAAEAAARIDKEVRAAVVAGVPESNVLLVQAVSLAQKLRDVDAKRQQRALEEEGLRKRRENAEKRKALNNPAYNPCAH